MYDISSSAQFLTHCHMLDLGSPARPDGAILSTWQVLEAPRILRGKFSERGFPHNFAQNDR
jgi:hypothetical protein